ncbi:unnamed protein product [Cochlearia groenlandica]
MLREIIKFFWMLNHSTSVTMVIHFAALLAIVAVIFALFWIYRTLRKYIVCDDKSQINSSVVVRHESTQGLIVFSLEELKQATDNFAEKNLIGHGRFGSIYIGMTRTTVVAIKKMLDIPSFLAKVINDLSKIRHCNVVSLLGTCNENRHQILVYEYLFNGNVRDYLHGYIGLKFKERLYIALGAAKGLQYLHSLNPPLAHGRFKTTKVLLDVELNAKISDAGLLRLVDVVDDLEVGLEHKEITNETGGDVYGFGLFLLELMTNEEPKELTSNEKVIKWINTRICSDTYVDKRINEKFAGEALESLVTITLKCLRFPAAKRPKMKEVVMVLEDIINYEVCSTRFSLGSEIFVVTA